MCGFFLKEPKNSFASDNENEGEIINHQSVLIEE
jgi:NNP family nitrate/nitrite transporter-like MFS transporter